MTTRATRRPRGAVSAGHAFEEAGFFLAKQALSREGVLRKARDQGFRQEVTALRELVRPHVFPDRASRDAACRGSMPDGIFVLRPTTADAQRTYSECECPFAVGPRMAEPGFEAVASFIVDHEVRKLAARCASEDFDVAPARPSSRSVVLAVSGAFFQLSFVERGRAAVEAMVPFGGIPTDELARTAAWILRRADALQALN